MPPLDPDAPRRVLLVEDNPACRETLALLLTIHGYEARAAPDGTSGLSEALAWRPDAVVADIGLPGMDGWELAERLRAQLGERLFLVAVTGYATAEDQERSRRAGFDHHLVKPADPAALLNLLAEAVGP
jgi:CheY-like chemotaxis protein